MQSEGKLNTYATGAAIARPNMATPAARKYVVFMVTFLTLRWCQVMFFGER